MTEEELNCEFYTAIPNEDWGKIYLALIKICMELYKEDKSE